MMPPASRPDRLAHARRRGLGVVEVIVIFAIMGFVAILFLMSLPRGRESARMATCQRNLMQIGHGLALYHQLQRHYPTVPALGGREGDSPLKAMLDSFAVPDLLELHDPSNPPKASQAPPSGIRVPGLACPSDPNAMTGPSSAVVSYRANAGDDRAGLDGPFAPGRTTTSAEVEAADGQGYTAAVAERLVGDGKDRHPALQNYARVPGPVPPAGCPRTPADRWQGDAGASWAEASWRSTLYNHTMTPDAPASCIAEDGKTAAIGASSGHVHRVNVLMMDGSLRVVSPSIDPKIWAGMGTVGRLETPPGSGRN